MSEKPYLTILAPYYWPETNAAARRLHAAATHFSQAGWKVTVIAPAPHHPENRVMEGYEGRWRRANSEGDIEVVRFSPFIVPGDNLLLRLVSETLFSTKAGFQALFTRPNVVLSSTPYMFLGPAGLLAARLTGAIFAWDVRDLTWQYVKATGKRTFGLDRLLGALMRFNAFQADVLTTATENQLVQLPSRKSAKRAVIANGLTPEFITDLRSGNPTFSDGRFTIVYAGLLGYPQGLQTLIQTAVELPDFRFVLAGDGADAQNLRRLATRLGASNVDFLGHIDGNQLRNLYASADVMVAMLRGSDAFKVAQPSKVWEYMATSKPVVFSGDCETTQLMLEHDMGLVTPPEDVPALSAALRQLAENPSERNRLGDRGHSFVMAERNRSRIVERWERLLSS